MIVSVLMPCYNAAPYVRAAVESVLAQTWHELELILIDDGSTDGLERALAGITDSRLKVVHQPNRGQCAAANRAFALCRGELIKFFDADDILSPDHLARQIARLGDRRDAVVLGEWARFYGDDPATAVFAPLPMYRDATPVEWLASEWMNARPMMQCGLWLIPKGILLQCGLWDERLSLINDFEFFARVLTHASDILYAPGARLCYRSGVAGSLSGRKSRRAVESAYLSLMLGTDQLLAAEDSPRTRQACANMLCDFEYAYYPDHPDLRQKMLARIQELGGSTLEPDGPPGFVKLRALVGWKAARLVQRAAEHLRLNGASRRALQRARAHTEDGASPS